MTFVKNNIWLALLAIVAIFRIFITINSPLAILPYAVHDDALFVHLGMHLLNGSWLGQYNEFTLAKGPGYPLFLALSSYSGLSISITHALFQIASIALIGVLMYRLTKSRRIASIAFCTLCLHPAGLLYEVQRILRDQIYWPQSLAILALFGISFLVPPQTRMTRLTLAVIAGLMLGWAWLTREEGIWFVPGLAVIVAAPILMRSLRRIKSREAVVSALTVAASFVVIINGFSFINYIIYGRYVGVDFKEPNFTAAIASLQSVVPKEDVPYLSVPLDVRRKVANNSKTFEPLASRLEPEVNIFARFSCSAYPQTCGDIGGGWFLWALRSAAADSGYYSSASEASTKFSAIASEIQAACKDGRLQCRKHSWSYIPHMTAEQIWSLPGKTISAIALAAFANPSTLRANSAMDHPEYEEFMNFLNQPVAAPKEAVKSMTSAIVSNLIKIYRIYMPALNAIGIIAFIFASLAGLLLRIVNADMILAAATWSMLASRSFILALIDATSFPALSDQYSLPSEYFMPVAAIASISAIHSLYLQRSARKSNA